IKAQAGKLHGFYEVDRGIYRGSHPSTDKHFKQLTETGIKTILSLQYSKINNAPVKKMAIKYGMNFINIPISAITSNKDLPDSKVIQILNIMQDDSLKPLYLHCLMGHDRTGLAIGLYRIHVQKWTPEAAYKEMRKFHFLPILVLGLYKYFKDHTAPGSLHLIEDQPLEDSQDFLGQESLGAY
ncbi:MAG: hypothetical protein ABIQ95_06505, partial [Bdellovibrionia bacterium]